MTDYCKRIADLMWDGKPELAEKVLREYTRPLRLALNEMCLLRVMEDKEITQLEVIARRLVEQYGGTDDR